MPKSTVNLLLAWRERQTPHPREGRTGPRPRGWSREEAVTALNAWLKAHGGDDLGVLPLTLRALKSYESGQCSPPAWILKAIADMDKPAPAKPLMDVLGETP